MSTTIKTRLEAVSSSLDTASNKANNLPNAGSGGSSGEAIYYTIKINVPGSIPESAHVITYEDVESDGGFTEHYTTAIPLMNYLNDSIEFDIKKGDIFIIQYDISQDDIFVVSPISGDYTEYDPAYIIDFVNNNYAIKSSVFKPMSDCTLGITTG